MNAKTEVKKIDEILRPLGFKRRKTTWNRASGPYVDVVEIQTSKSGDLITLNVGVLDSTVYLLCWDSKPPPFVEEPSCTVRARIGQLMGENDIWWPLTNDPDDNVVHAVVQHAIPFISRMHSRAAMVEFLVSEDVVNKNYPLPVINLAILQSGNGARSGACATLALLYKKTAGAWRVRIREVSERIGCP